MIELKVYNIEGKETGALQLNEEIFGVAYNSALVHQVVVAILANKRQGTKSTLTRAEVSGGGIKPYRQKGTGRARQGSTRSPQWRHGGVVFAPKPRDYSKKVNKQMKLGAFKCALSEKIRNGEVIVVENMDIADAKTKLMAKVIKNFDAEGKKTLVVLNGQDEKVIRASKNIQGLTTCDAKLLNVYELVRNGKCIITVDAVKALEEVIG